MSTLPIVLTLPIGPHITDRACPQRPTAHGPRLGAKQHTRQQIGDVSGPCPRHHGTTPISPLLTSSYHPAGLYTGRVGRDPWLTLYMALPHCVCKKSLFLDKNDLFLEGGRWNYTAVDMQGIQREFSRRCRPSIRVKIMFITSISDGIERGHGILIRCLLRYVLIICVQRGPRYYLQNLFNSK